MIRAILAAVAILISTTTATFAQPQITPEQLAWYNAMQERFARFRDVRAEAIHDPQMRWTVAFSRIDTRGNRWTVVAFGINADAPGTSDAWRAQIWTNTAETREASAAACPALLTQLAALEELPMPTIDLPRMRNETPPTFVPSPTLDGDDNRIWTWSAGWDRRRGFVNEIELNGDIGSPVALWADQMLAALELCWRPAGSTD